MKAALLPRIELAGRTRIEKDIPISTPFTIFVDPASICNLECRFCPTGNRKIIRKSKRSKNIMDFNLFRKTVNDISTFNSKIKVLRLYKDGEPLLNSRLPDMIAYAKARGCADQIDTTTNGLLLDPDVNLKLIKAGLDRINISVNGMSSRQYGEFTGRRINFNAYVENIRHFYNHRGSCLVCVKICGDILTEYEKKRFLDTFGDISDRIFIEHVAPCWPEFKPNGIAINNEFGIYGQTIEEVMVCPYIFYSISVNSDGSVSLCFLDWARKLIIGDVNKESIKEIWNGKLLAAYRKVHLQFQRKNLPVCGNCGQLSHGMPDNIDASAAEILNRLISKGCT